MHDTQRKFVENINRSYKLIAVAQYIEKDISQLIDSSDIKRAAVITTISAFDTLIHELYLHCVRHHLENKKPLNGLRVPFNATITLENTESVILSYVKETISYQTFVDVDRMKDALKPFCNTLMQNIAKEMITDQIKIKRNVKLFYRWRNRIAHESDLNPDISGPELFPIDENDVRDMIDFFSRYGAAICSVLKKGGY